MKPKNESNADLDVIVVGAGFSGMHILHEFLKRDYNVHLFDDGEGVGGTWDKNNYPGARVDSEVWIYQFTDPQIWQNYTFTEKFPTWRELKPYFNFVADQWGLRPHMTFKTRLEGASFDENECVWHAKFNDGVTRRARHLVLAMGSTTTPVMPKFAGIESFKGESYHSARWPKQEVSFSGKRVAVIGTGASGVQVIQEASKTADHLTVYQRTPNLALPMGQERYTRDEYAKMKPLIYPAMAYSRQTFGGFPYDLINRRWNDLNESERNQMMRQNWEQKGFRFWLGAPADLFFDEECNRAHYNFWRDETRKRIKKEHLIEILAPTEPPHPFGAKRPCLEQWYFDLYNQDNVDLIDTNTSQIERITENGIVAGAVEREFDCIVYATGFDNCTGAIGALDIRDGTGRTIGDVWDEKYLTYLGKMVPGFPNLLFTYALQSPSAFLNGPTAAELEGDWVVNVVEDMSAKGIRRYDAKPDAAHKWAERCNDVANMSLLPKAKSWYMGANVPGKRPEIQPFIGGQVAYRAALNEEIEMGYPNLVLERASSATAAAE
ncbi:NAD(P)/FAD-dependent oxidoreductase [Parvibaculum sp.]|uniref:flavin-containing monooxygenase n=1 Tax=Parvibaculum sp. TaxID=2024848 RepID=UPI002730500E|nr:NAD(P)/FAD-dependent oxidoreductase [Parvibaculum sp.]MDP1627386.1 NAD(P)/FAD-dependent oxidoreductase [Parvibaculum sp.]MDP2148565.1 NAD(P)/FAD-dependent oxidoreductase [Parvibaculum sp.]MDP3327522.1 NAD(P)/FAD-dependent oxidoreductase [Parvibaculum sp.]